MPHAVDVGDVAKVVMRRPDGETENYTIPWTKTGLPLINNGPVPTAGGGVARKKAAFADRDWRSVLRGLQRVRVNRPEAIIGFGARTPFFALPTGFEQRLPVHRRHSGTFRAGGYRIGFAFPTTSPPMRKRPSISFTEISFFEANTDGLIIDDMRNPGDSSISRTLSGAADAHQHRVTGFEIRATSNGSGSIPR
jgi:hypothetical protein